MLQGIEIRDTVPGQKGGYLSFDLKDLLPLTGERAIASQWQCCFVECTGENAEELHTISGEGRNISGDELLRIASGVLQVIDGQFEAYSSGAVEPWLVIKAIDSSWFEVWSDDSDVLVRVRKNFRDVSDLPPDAA